MTEDAAKQLGCPFATGSYGGAGANRNISQSQYIPQCLCVASACMAWYFTSTGNGDCSLINPQINPQGAAR